MKLTLSSVGACFLFSLVLAACGGGGRTPGALPATGAGVCTDLKKAERGGSIPGATHLEWSDVLDPKTRRFKTPATLAKLFKDAGVNLGRPQVTYCQSGGRAAVLAFALELMGAREVRNYYRSWSEWGNAADTPVVTPKKK